VQKSNAALPEANEPPPLLGGPLNRILKLARSQLKEYLRSRRFVLVIGAVAVIGLIETAVLGYYRPASIISNPVTFYSGGWGGPIDYLILFAAVIFGADAIAGEFQNKTGYFLMSLPLRRSSIYAGKYLAALTASITMIALYLIILVLNGVYYFGASAFPWQLGASFALSLVYLLAVLGSAFLFSSLFKTGTYAVLLVAVLFLIGFSILQAWVTDLVKIEPWFLISYASGILADIFQTPYPPHAQAVIVHGSISSATLAVTTYTPTVIEGLAIMVGYFFITTALGLFLFEREEFT
jgi:ABC-2 type transport system permease protein